MVLLFAQKYYLIPSIPWSVLFVVVLKKFDVEGSFVVSCIIEVAASKEIENINRVHYEIDYFTL